MNMMPYRTRLLVDHKLLSKIEQTKCSQNVLTINNRILKSIVKHNC